MRESVNSSTRTMLTPLSTREEDNGKTSVEYYYHSQPHQHYYCQIPFNHQSNHFHHPSIYETNPYYSISSGYSQPALHHHHSNEENSDQNQVTNTGYTPTYHSPDSQPNEMFYPPMYDYNVSPGSTLSSNPMFRQNSNYVQSSVDQVHCSTSNSTGYPTIFSDLSLDGACRSDSIIVELIDRPLWLKFAPHTLENIITKTGRRMFPKLEFKVYGLKPEATYDMYVDMVLLDVNHWKFNSGAWIPSGQAEQSQKTDYHYSHPDSPNSGAHWLRNEKISFAKLKLTNNKQLAANHRQHSMTVILNSMHKYMPRLNIIEVSNPSLDQPTEPIKHTFTFPETQFIAVTAYQNTDVTQLKIDNNPFAKGFRESPDHRTTYHSYSYESEAHHGDDYYEHLPPHKKKRHR